MRSFVQLSLLVVTLSTTLADDLHPFPVAWRNYRESALDLRRFLDAPAGGGGFVRPDGDRLVDGRGERVRLWGVNLGGVHPFMPEDHAVELADALSRLGVNVVRMHGIDSSWGRSVIDRSGATTGTLDEERLAQFDRLVAELIRRGVYVNLNLNVFRTYGPDDGMPDAESLGVGKWVTHFHPRAIELQKQFARQLLTHVNPHTGRAYVDEPGVVVVEIVNENSLIEGWVNGRLVGRDGGWPSTWSIIPDAYADELNRQFNAFLADNFDDAILTTFRRQAGVDADASLTLLDPSQFDSASDERFAADFRFIVSTERKFLSEMRRFIKDELRLRSMLIGDADHNDSINGYPHLLNLATFDYIDGHGYWQHPKYGDEISIGNDPMVNDPTDSTIVQFARAPMAGKPFVVSETQHPYPHRYACEGMPIMAAYAMLQDWDGVLFHEWGVAPSNSDDHIGRDRLFRFSEDPMKVMQLAAAALMFHRGDVETSGTTVTRGVRVDGLVDETRRRSSAWKRRPFFDDAFDLRTPLVHRTVWSPIRGGERPSDYPVIDDGDLVSDTGQLRWGGVDRGRGRVTIDTPRTAASIGFTRDAGGGSQPAVGPMRNWFSNDFAAVQMSSLDDKPLVESERILLVVADRAVDADLTWRDDLRTVADFGDGPVSIRPVRGAMYVNGLSIDDPVVDVLDSIGRPTGTFWPTDGESGGFRIDVGDPPGLSAVIRSSTDSL